jgi:hypothetical protein
MTRVTTLADRYLPSKAAIGEGVEGLGRLAGKILTPALIAKELMYTSPEEIATLKAAEAKRRAQGWKPLNER